MSNEQIIWCNKKLEWLRVNRDAIIGGATFIVAIFLPGIIDWLFDMYW